jgi:hypothetical protein
VQRPEIDPSIPPMQRYKATQDLINMCRFIRNGERIPFRQQPRLPRLATDHSVDPQLAVRVVEQEDIAGGHLIKGNGLYFDEVAVANERGHAGSRCPKTQQFASAQDFGSQINQVKCAGVNFLHIT